MTVSRRLGTDRVFALAVVSGILWCTHSAALGLDRTPSRAAAPLSVDGAFSDLPRTLAAAPARASDLVFAADRLSPADRHELPALSSDERRGLGRSEKGRTKVGLVRRLESAARLSTRLPAIAAGGRLSVDGGLLESDADGSLTWTAAFVSRGAAGIRLQIADADLAGGRAYLYARSGEVQGPYTFDRPIPAEGFWTNTVFADEVFLEVRLPRSGSPRLSVAALAHLEGASLTSMSTTCFVDASCVPAGEFAGIDSASRAVATLLFEEGTGFYACSGGLVATADRSFEPYLLTANHCFSSQSAASTLEAVFDYRNPTCGGAYPSISSFPRTLGATLLATGATSDFTLVRLAQSPPPGSFFLGWSTEDYSRRGGTAIYRLSYPAPAVGIWPQYYSRHTISAVPTPGSCSGAPQGHFIYSKDSYGGTAEGSSGSPVLLADGRIVGQLLGSCGSNTGDDCDATSNSTIDGAFAVSYPQLERWLNASGTSTPPATTCVPNATTLCLNGNRFQAQVSWRVASQGTAGNGTAISLSGDTGYFWFFSSGNVELVVKALDGRAVNGYFWIFYGALSDVEYTLTVTDTATGAVKTYSNPQGRLASTADTSAFR